LTLSTGTLADGRFGTGDYYTLAQLKKLHSGEEKLFNNIEQLLKFETVAEVIKSERCFAQVKVGDKLVFDPFLNPAKSKGIMCPKALLPVMSQIGAIWEMAAEWAASGKEGVPEIVWRYIRCLDPGLNDGGLGGVVYRISLQPTA
jgi:hypothetical protein